MRKGVITYSTDLSFAFGINLRQTVSLRDNYGGNRIFKRQLRRQSYL